MRRLDTELLGLQIVALENASIVGEIDGLIVDDVNMRIAGFLVDLGLYEARVLPFDRLHALGEDAAVIEQAAAVGPITSDPRLENLARKGVTVSFSRAITKSGRSVGTVGDFYLDTESGAILGLELIPAMDAGGPIPEPAFVGVESIHKLGRDVTVLHDDFEQVAAEWSPATAEPDQPVAEPHPAGPALTLVRPPEEAAPTDEAAPSEAVGLFKEVEPADATGLPSRETEPSSSEPVDGPLFEAGVAADQLEDTVTDIPAPDLGAPSQADDYGERAAGPAIDAPPMVEKADASPTSEAEGIAAETSPPRHFLLGKRVLRRIEDTEGGLIAEAGDIVTFEMIQRAKATDQLLILSLNVE